MHLVTTLLSAGIFITAHRTMAVQFGQDATASGIRATLDQFDGQIRRYAWRGTVLVDSDNFLQNLVHPHTQQARSQSNHILCPTRFCVMPCPHRFRSQRHVVLMIFTLGLYFFIVTSIVTTYVQFNRTWTAGYIATAVGALLLAGILLSVFPWPTQEVTVNPVLKVEQERLPRTEPRSQFYMDATRAFGCPPEPWWPVPRHVVRQLNGSNSTISQRAAAEAAGLTTPVNRAARARSHSNVIVAEQ